MAIFLFVGVIFVFSRIAGFDALVEVVYDQFTIPPQFSEFLTRPWTLFTYSFAHSLTDIFHILFNMLALYWFGRLFIEYLGSDKLVALYVLGGMAGAIFYLVMFNTIPYFIEASNFNGMVGASAAVFAIMVAVATLLPDYTFYLLFLGPVKIKYIVFVYIVISFIGSVGPNAGGNLAHLGGALMGFVYMKQLQAGVNWGGWITAVIDWVKDLFQPRPKVKVSYRKEEAAFAQKKNVKVTSEKGKISQEEIDAILDKISDGGYESLTKDEKEKLFNASKK
ncbi:rhomboid family protein [Chryseotalea sanaruensis]|uniref:rhomboid family protein n=1 Tax=Chryseotalea sanaruensis TaxID=2482724 RepID=UPI00278C70F8|nr:rhomboid family intramembrane serine protease [Chryseotalea sanaruensis]